MKKYFLILAVLIFIGCNGALPIGGSKQPTAVNTTQKGEKPEWFYKSSINGKLGGVGIAGMHYRGKNAQRTLAISRGIDEIAMQKGIVVDTEITRNESVSNGIVQTSMDVYSKQYANNQKVTAKLMEIWEDPKTKEIYAWMLEK